MVPNGGFTVGGGSGRRQLRGGVGSGGRGTTRASGARVMMRVEGGGVKGEDEGEKGKVGLGIATLSMYKVRGRGRGRGAGQGEGGERKNRLCRQ